MHVAVIAPEDLPIPAKRGGSVQIYLEHLYAQLRKQKSLQITLITPGFQSDQLAFSHNVRHKPISERGDKYWSHVMSYLWTVQPDVIQIDNRPARAMRIKRMFFHKRVILNLHSLTFLGPRHIAKRQVKTALSTMDAVVCNSHNLKRTIQQRYGLRRAAHFHVIYPGVPGVTQKGVRLSFPLSRRPHKPLRILYVGRVIEQKGIHVAIKAIRILGRSAPVTLTIVGRTPPWEQAYRNKLQRLARHLDVHFVGFTKPEQIGRIYRQHDVFICPSQKHEAFGLVNLEAMQYGLPVVASRIGGIPEAIGKKGGISIQSYTNAKAFASAIQLMQNKHTYRYHSRHARLQAERFSWTKTSKRFTHLYRTV